MAKKISKVEHRFGGHVKLEFEDGSATMVTRGAAGLATLKPGDYWPPAPILGQLYWPPLEPAGLPSAADLDAVAEEQKQEKLEASNAPADAIPSKE